MTPSVIISLCQLAFSIVSSVIAVIWKMAKQDSKINQNEKDIKELQNGQTDVSANIASINTTLASIATKIDLLLSGKIKIGDGK